MSIEAKAINAKYLAKMQNATETSEKAFYRIREFWWPHFISSFSTAPRQTLDQLDLCMDAGQAQLRQVATNHATNLGFAANSPEHIQRVTQVLKSNTGKMFERLIALSIAHALHTFDSDYCVWSFTADLAEITNVINKDELVVSVKLLGASYQTAIDADFLIFDPNNADADYFLVSIKSTLKDRFHNVPFWNLLRHIAITKALSNVTPADVDALKRPKYIAVCSDLAEEQPDFSATSGPRNMLCLDAALLDGAYVTASRAKGLGGTGTHLGHDRSAPFFPLNTLISHLAPNLP